MSGWKGHFYQQLLLSSSLARTPWLKELAAPFSVPNSNGPSLLETQEQIQIQIAPLFSPICLGIAVLDHRVLRNVRISPDPDAVTQECSILRQGARPKEGRGLQETLWDCPLPPTPLLRTGSLVWQAAWSFFMAQHVCCFFYVTQAFLKGPFPWNIIQP